MKHFHKWQLQQQTTAIVNCTHEVLQTPYQARGGWERLGDRRCLLNLGASVVGDSCVSSEVCRAPDLHLGETGAHLICVYLMTMFSRTRSSRH